MSALSFRSVGLGARWVLAFPVLLEWGSGAAHPLLDWLSGPGALLLNLPSALGIYGLVLVVGLAIAEQRLVRRVGRALDGV